MYMGDIYAEKEKTAKECGCKYYINLTGDEMIVFRLAGNKIKTLINGYGEYVVTSENFLINVTANSNVAIEEEVKRGKKATGYIGTVIGMWYADAYEQII